MKRVTLSCSLGWADDERTREVSFSDEEWADWVEEDRVEEELSILADEFAQEELSYWYTIDEG